MIGRRKLFETMTASLLAGPLVKLAALPSLSQASCENRVLHLDRNECHVRRRTAYWRDFGSDRSSLAGSLFCYDPASQQVGVQPVIERHCGDRHTRPATGRYDLGLELSAMPAATTPIREAAFGSVHVSTKKLSGHDPPHPSVTRQDDFPGRLRLFETGSR